MARKKRRVQKSGATGTSEPPEHPTSTVDQHQQTVDGTQINVAGDYHNSANYPLPSPQQSSYQGVQYVFIFGALVLVALVILALAYRNPTYQPLPTSTERSATLSPEVDTSEVNNSTNCSDQSAVTLPETQTEVIVGTHDRDIPLDGNDYVVLALTENSRRIGWLYYQLFPAEGFMKLQAILDADCRQLLSHPGITLLNWESYQFSLNDQDYAIRVGMQPGIVELRFWNQEVGPPVVGETRLTGPQSSEGPLLTMPTEIPVKSERTPVQTIVGSMTISPTIVNGTTPTVTPTVGIAETPTILMTFTTIPLVTETPLPTATPTVPPTPMGTPIPPTSTPTVTEVPLPTETLAAPPPPTATPVPSTPTATVTPPLTATAIPLTLDPLPEIVVYPTAVAIAGQGEPGEVVRVTIDDEWDFTTPSAYTVTVSDSGLWSLDAPVTIDWPGNFTVTGVGDNVNEKRNFDLTIQSFPSCLLAMAPPASQLPCVYIDDTENQVATAEEFSVIDVNRVCTTDGLDVLIEIYYRDPQAGKESLLGRGELPSRQDVCTPNRNQIALRDSQIEALGVRLILRAEQQLTLIARWRSTNTGKLDRQTAFVVRVTSPQE